MFNKFDVQCTRVVVEKQPKFDVALFSDKDSCWNFRDHAEARRPHKAQIEDTVWGLRQPLVLEAQERRDRW